MRVIICSCLLFLCTMLLAQKPKSYSTITTNLADNVVASPSAKKPLKLGVAPFTATRSSIQHAPQFGEYLTETITGLLGNHSDKITLFERTRLDAILREQELELSDLIKPATAIKIGQLAPIDALLSGTYTKLKSYVDISARLIDVSTGEVLMSYTGRIKLDKNINTLFTENTTTETITVKQENQTPVSITIINSKEEEVKAMEEKCNKRIAEFRTQLNDLSTPARIDQVVANAISTPFDNRCGKLHYDAMYAFNRYKIENSIYKKFILHTLDTLAYPSADDRAYESIRFLAADNDIDEEEWRTGFTIVKRVGDYWLSNYLGTLIAKPNRVDNKIIQQRITTYFDLAAASKIGLPKPITFEMAYFEMMEGLRDRNDLREFVHSRYASRLHLDDKTKATMFSEIASMYKKETDKQRKTEIIQWLAEFVNSNEYPKAHEQVYDFVREFQLTQNESRNQEIQKEFVEKDLQQFTQQSKGRLAEYAMKTEYKSQQEDRIQFCVKYEVPIAGVIPTMEEARQILKSNNLEEQHRTMKLLMLMGSKVKLLEPEFIGLLNRRSLEDRTQLAEIQTMAITLLGVCKTTSSVAIDYMITVLPHYGNDTYAAEAALAIIGKPAVNALINRLDKTTIQDGGLQFQLITILGKIGKDAAPAQRSIKRVLQATGNDDIRYAAEAALQAISE